MRTSRVVAIALTLALAWSAPKNAGAVAQGTAITYQGHLIHQGQPANGQFDFEFRLYDAVTGGTAVGGAVSQTLQVSAGLFTTIIDLGNPFTSGQKYWLEIKVKPNGGAGAAQALAPRTELAAVPVALTASKLALPLNQTVNLPGNVLQLKNDGAGPMLVTTSKAVSPAAGVALFNTGSGAGLQVSATCEAPEAAFKVFNTGTGRGIFASSTLGRPVDRAPDISPEQFAGGMSESYAAASPNVLGGGAALTTTGFIPPGIGSIAIGDVGTWGYAIDSVGVIGQCPSGVGVYGTTDSLNGNINTDPGVIGVRGRSAYGTGVAGESQFGAAVRGTATSASALAGYFEGDVEVTGNLVAGSKNFLIDHPLDPDHRRLAHASIESSEMLDLYRGTVTLDADGSATVSFPDWFEALNRDFSYQLTPIGKPAPGLYVAHEVRDGRFRIAGGPPGARVCWLVTGVRHDRFAREHPLQVEQPKPESVAGSRAPASSGGGR